MLTAEQEQQNHDEHLELVRLEQLKVKAETKLILTQAAHLESEIEYFDGQRRSK